MKTVGRRKPAWAFESLHFRVPYKSKDEQREYQRAWVARRRAEYFAGKVCAVCGSEDALELDHVDPTKKVSHAIWSWAAAKREAELAKCRPLCHDCHLSKSRGEKATGAHNGMSKLDAEKVRKIRSLAETTSNTQLARMFGVDEKAIRSLLKGETWNHVK